MHHWTYHLENGNKRKEKTGKLDQCFKTATNSRYLQHWNQPEPASSCCREQVLAPQKTHLAERNRQRRAIRQFTPVPDCNFPWMSNPRDLKASRTFPIDPFSPTESRIWKLDRSHNQSPKSSSVGLFYPLNSSRDSLLCITTSTLQWPCLCFPCSSVASLWFLCSSWFAEETREGRWKRERGREDLNIAIAEQVSRVEVSRLPWDMVAGRSGKASQATDGDR
jgi:hypothetical protein